MKLLHLPSVVCLAGFLAILVAGCSEKADIGQVSGKVTVDGQIPAVGSSITFFPLDGNSSSAGAVINDGNYSVEVPAGESKVEIRIPKQVPNPNASTQGPGAGDRVTESLPPKYNDKSELKLKVVAGDNQKDWDVSTKP